MHESVSECDLLFLLMVKFQQIELFVANYMKRTIKKLLLFNQTSSVRRPEGRLRLFGLSVIHPPSKQFGEAGEERVSAETMSLLASTVIIAASHLPSSSTAVVQLGSRLVLF